MTRVRGKFEQLQDVLARTKNARAAMRNGAAGERGLEIGNGSVHFEEEDD